MTMFAIRKPHLATLATVLLLLLMLLHAPAHASYTAQDEATDNYFHDWTFSTISPDRHWLAYSSNARLAVVDTTGATADRIFTLPGQIDGLAIANDGDHLAVVGQDGLALLNLNKPALNAETGILEWRVLPPLCTSPNQQQTSPDYVPSLPPAALALTGDGRYLATVEVDCESSTVFIRVSDLRTQAPAKKFPVADSYNVGHVEFVDDDSKLAVFGPQIHALWDLHSGALLSSASFNTNFGDVPGFGAAVDRSTGDEYLSGASRHLARIDLSDCSKPATSSAIPAQEGIYTVGAGGSWYAVATGTQIDVFKTEGNKKIASFKAPFGVAYLSQGSAPGSLFAISRSKGKYQIVNTEDPIPEVAQHAVFQLPKAAMPPSPAAAKKAWPQCRMLDEAAGARDIVRNAAPVVHKAETTFHGCTTPYCHTDGPPKGQPRGGCGFNQAYSAWGRNEKGEIWLDRCSDIVRIDPHGGTVLEQLPTPRNGKFVSVTWFEHSGFLNWQGDTVTFRGFHGERKVLVTKPGWRALYAFVEGGNTFGVMWGQNKFLESGKVSEHGLLPMGSGLAVRYDFDTLRVQAQQSAAALPFDASRPPWETALIFDPSTYDAETEGSPPTDLEQRAEIYNAPDFHRTPLQATPDYRWEHFIFDSVRMLSTPAHGEAQAVMWDGLFAWQGKIAAARPATLFDFGAKAAVQRANGDVDLYDGKERRILAHVPIEAGRFVQKVEWMAGESMLVVGSCANNEADDCRLDFYAVATAM